MFFREYQPPLCLKPYVRYYWTLQLNPIPALHSGQRFLTESFELTFNLAAPIEIVNCDGQIKSISATGITGPMSRPMRLRSTGRVNLFGVCFRPGGGYPSFSTRHTSWSTNIPMWMTSGEPGDATLSNIFRMTAQQPDHASKPSMSI
jgi:hypothetical protein